MEIPINGTAIVGWFMMKNVKTSIEVDDLGVPSF
jgi:hypothetical protein